MRFIEAIFRSTTQRCLEWGAPRSPTRAKPGLEWATKQRQSAARMGYPARGGSTAFWVYETRSDGVD